MRVLLAPHFGFYGDLRLFSRWAVRLDQVGPRHFYAPGYFVDYPPGYLYVLLVVAKMSRVFGLDAPSYLLLKLPAILGDLGLAWVAGELAVRLAPASIAERFPVRPIAAAAVLFNPAVLALGAVWGQVDVVPVLLVVWAFLRLFTGRPTLRRETAGMVLFTLGAAMKPQSAFVFPVVALALAWRHLRGGRRNLWPGARRIAALAVVSVGLLVLTGLPFGLGPVALIKFYGNSSSTYPVTSAWAFNLWGAVGFWKNDLHGDSVQLFAGIPAFYVGLLAFLASTAYVLWRAVRSLSRGEDESRAFLVAGVAVSCLAFALLTRMHERYLFLSLALLAPLVIFRGFRWGYAALSALFVANLYFPFVYFNEQWLTNGGVRLNTLRVEPLFRWLYGGFATDTLQKKALSLAVLGTCLWIAWRGWRWIREGGPGSKGLAAAAIRPIGPVEQAITVGAGVRSPDHPATARRGNARAFMALVAGTSRAVLARTRSIASLDGKARPEEERAPERPERWLRMAPFFLVALAIGFNLFVLRTELTPAQYPNDSALHLQMVRWAEQRIRAGHLPLDGWFPYHALGSSHFHHYQSLPHALTGLLAIVFGAGATFRWTLYLLLALWPLSVYWGARLLGWGRWASGAAALVSPLIVSAPGYGFEHGSYTWRGYGVWSQLWGMWLLPLAWGLSWRAIARKGSYALAAVALALTVACHFIAGYLALVSVAVLALVTFSGILRRLGRAAIVTVGALLVGAWVVVPLVQDSRWSTQSVFYRKSIFADSYGARKVLGWLFTGRMFDSGRFPVISLLVAVGVFVCLARSRHDERARALLALSTASLVLFFGRPTLGPVLKLLPGSGDLQIHRFIMGVHMGGILLAGVGAAWLGGRLASLAPAALRTLGPAAVVAGVVVVGIVALYPAWHERASWDLAERAMVSYQRSQDATDGADVLALIQEAKERGGGRIFAGMRATWGSQYEVGAVPVYGLLEDHEADAIGLPFRTIASLSTDVEAWFDENNPAQFDLYDVRYLVMPSTRKPAVPATLIDQAGRHRLWRVDTTGYLDVVDTIAPPLTADRATLGDRVVPFLRSDLPGRKLFPTIAFGGRDAAMPTIPAGQTPPPGAAGSVVQERDGLQDGTVSGVVMANRPSVVLLKSSFDPRWKVTVDGIAVPTQMVAPSYVGVEIPVGRHEVMFTYQPYPHYLWLLLLGALTILGLIVGERYGSRLLTALRRVREAAGSETSETVAGIFIASPASREKRRILGLRSRLQRLPRETPVYVAALVLVAIAFAWRAWLLHSRLFDPDEFDHVHSSWAVAHGMLPYRDYFQIFPPLFYFFLAPFFRLFHVDTSASQAVAFLFFARRLMWIFTGVILAETFWLGKLWRNARVGAVGTVFLATTFVFQQKTLEIRPDVPGVMLLLLSLILLVRALRLEPPHRRQIGLTFSAAGVSLGCALLFTQKPVFALPGVAVALLVYLRRRDVHGTLRARASNVGWFCVGVSTPILLIMLYFLARGGVSQLLHDTIRAGLGPITRQPATFFVRTLTKENPVLVAVGALGALRLVPGVLRGERFDRGDFLLLLAAASLVGGVFVTPSPYFQYFLMFLPLLSLFAGQAVLEATRGLVMRPRNGEAFRYAGVAAAVMASAVVLLTAYLLRSDWHPIPVQLFVLLGGAAIVLAVGARLGAADNVVAALVVVVLSVVPLYRELAWNNQTDPAQLERIEYVIEHSDPQEGVLDGFSGAGTFRPQVTYYGSLPVDLQPIVPSAERTRLLEELRAGLLQPRFVVLDNELQAFLGPEGSAVIEQHYRPAAVEPIWQR